MQAKLIWKENLQFSAQADGHPVLMDAKPPVGQGKGQTPKQLLLAALCGCTAVDVASLMRKQRQDMKRFEVTAEAATRNRAHPAVFTAIDIAFPREPRHQAQIGQ
jgi:putative redox protein